MTDRKVVPIRRGGEARQLSDIYRPIVDGLDPSKLYANGEERAPLKPRGRSANNSPLTPEERDRLGALLRKAGYRRTWRDDVEDYWSDVRITAGYHATTAILAALATLALAIAPFALGWMK